MIRGTDTGVEASWETGSRKTEAVRGVADLKAQLGLYSEQDRKPLEA